MFPVGKADTVVNVSRHPDCGGFFPPVAHLKQGFLSLPNLLSIADMLYSIDGRPAHDALTTDGFVIVDNLIKTELFGPLREAAERAIEKARAGEWKERRLVGTPFPPWNEGTDVWGVQHLLHPDLGEAIFAEWYGSEEMVHAVESFDVHMAMVMPIGLVDSNAPRC